MEKRTNPTQRTPDTILIVIFVIALGLPMAGRAFNLDAQRHRTRVPKIEMNSESFWTYPARFTTYFNDHFPYRDALIRWHALAVYRTLNASPSNVVLLGRDGWIYYADDDSLTDYRSAVLFTDAELAAWKTVLEDRRAWLAARNIHFLFVLVPDKYVIYPEHMPTAIHRVHEERRMDQLAAYLAVNSSVDVLNLRGPLEEQKKIERVYHLTDTHWNDRGAFVGYQQIMTRVAAWFPVIPGVPGVPGVKPLPRDLFEAVTEQTPGWDLPEMVRLVDVTSEENLSMIPRVPRQARVVDPPKHSPLWTDWLLVLERDDKNLPRAVVLRDSFGSALVPFMAEHFRRVAFCWEYDFDVDLIEREYPDVVIQEMAGRKLFQIEPYNPVGVIGANGKTR